MEKMYMYALIEGTQAHSGFAAARSPIEVYEDIQGNYRNPYHIIVQEIPELIPRVDENGEWTGGVVKARMINPLMNASKDPIKRSACQ